MRRGGCFGLVLLPFPFARPGAEWKSAVEKCIGPNFAGFESLSHPAMIIMAVDLRSAESKAT